MEDSSLTCGPVHGLSWRAASKVAPHPVLSLAIDPFPIGQAFLISAIIEEIVRSILRKDK